MSNSYKKLGIIGCGVMGQAIFTSIIKNPETTELYPNTIYTTNFGDAAVQRVAKVYDEFSQNSIKHVNLSSNENEKVFENCDVVILSCKPFMVETIFEKIQKWDVKLIVSIVAGWSIDMLKEATQHIESKSGKSTKFVRIMTNTPAKFGYGCCVISFENEGVDFEDFEKKTVDQIFQNCGSVVELPEKHMDAATSLVGSGPAFVLLMIESMIDAGIKMGIPYKESKDCAIKVMEGTSKMVELTGEHPSVLKHQVCTPGGTTISGLIKMEENGVKSGIISGLLEAKKVAGELGKKK
ncbi:hypothetical protein ACO0RG_000043 [Hanseniaspora osmophila]|uniref:Pyrroline-5-carboxylate reductase n=1 Tax=Hanseniaspora osmophila TaxID=56408 RepID=A0A1E5R4W1_9ASCO|nr:Pyrroline-5-carboxylate reductase [Hanseniaspora osmophila]